MRVLCVAEKPSISKEVARILSGGAVRTRQSDNKYIKNYDFQFDFPGFGVCDVTMTAVVGHLRRLDFPPSCAWGKVPPGRLFESPIKRSVDPAKASVHANIAAEARSAQVLMIWTDCDREGEAIGYEVLESARSSNAALTPENTWRAVFSHLERAHVVSAARSPQKLNMRAVDAVDCRSEIDLRVGSSFTRYLSDLLRSKNKLVEATVSYGTCQFPTLGFVVDRYKRVKNFTSEKFWYIHVEATKDGVAVPFSWAKGHLFDRLFVALCYERCMQSGSATIAGVERKPTTNFRPFPLTTVQLQKDCATFFKMSAKDTLDAAEKLYQAGFLSYPRTETDRFSAAMDLGALVQKQAQDPRWGPYAGSLRIQTPRAGSHDDKAHPPIHPVNYARLEALADQKQRKVYEYVVRRFLACCSDDARGFQTTATLNWGAERFTASGLEVTETNYLDVYVYRKWQSSKQLPNFVTGETLALRVAEVKEGKTSPPKHMTETELIALMDVNGIGTDATIAEHITKIIDRDYVLKRKSDGNDILVPTELGMGLIEGFSAIVYENNVSLSKPFLRRRLEVLLKDIEEGRTTKAQALRENVDLYRKAFARTAQSETTLIAEFKRYQTH